MSSSITPYLILKICLFRGWRNGSVVKRTGCSTRRPRFNSHHPGTGSQQSNYNFRDSDTLLWPPQAPGTLNHGAISLTPGDLFLFCFVFSSFASWVIFRLRKVQIFTTWHIKPSSNFTSTQREHTGALNTWKSLKS